ncbi:MAG: tetraacyldisaccharide 4'-kinase, partial [Acidobacteriota bacterium]
PLLAIASRPLEWVNAAARAAYRLGLRTSCRAPAPVISVGNIALGGTGKTPLVAALARTLLDSGARPAVLTRGYRRRTAEPRLVRGEQGVRWEEIGDEPALLARALPRLPMVVDADRVRGAARAVAEAGATHLLLDDGFQHWRLARELDLVATPMEDPLCRRRPRREHPRALRRAHAVLLTDSHPAGVAEARAAVTRVAPGIPVLATAVLPRAVHHQGVCHPPQWLAGQRVIAVAGIASPVRFFAQLAALGAELVTLVPLPDHHVLTEPHATRLLRQADRERALLILTAKDVVKLPPRLASSAAWLEIETVPLEGSFLDLLSPVLSSPPSGPP